MIMKRDCNEDIMRMDSVITLNLQVLTFYHIMENKTKR